MASEPAGFKRLSVPVDQAFSMEDQVGETPSGRAYRAFDRTTRKGVVVWIAKEALAAGSSGEVSRFRSRLERLADLKEVVAPLYFGVDVRNLRFVVLPAYDGRPLDYPTNDPVEVERRISGCFAVIEGIHATGQGCGDLCLESFVIRRDGSVGLFCPLGELRGQTQDTRAVAAELSLTHDRGSDEDIFVRDARALRGIAAALSGSKVLRVPQRARSKNDSHYDVGEFLTSPELASALDQGKSAVSTLRMAFEQHRAEHRGSHGGTDAERLGPRAKPLADKGSDWGESGVRARIPQSPHETYEAELERSTEELISDPHAVRSSPFRLSGPVALLGGIVVAGIFAISLSVKFVGESPAIIVATPSPYDESYYAFSDKLKRLEQLGEIQAYSAALVELDSARSEAERKLVMAVLARIARASGFVRAGDLLTAGGASAGDAQAIVRLKKGIAAALVPGISTGQRFDAAVRVFDIDPIAATTLAVALAFDIGDVDLARDFVVRGVKERLPIVDVNSYPTVGLIILAPPLLNRFYEDIPEHSTSLTRATLQSLLQELNRSGGMGVSLVAQLMSLASLGQSSMDLIVHELGSGDAMPPSVRHSLIRGISGEVDISDITPLREWFAADAFKTLGAILIGARDPVVRSSIVEVLAGPSSGNPYVQRVATFCLSQYSEHAQGLFPLIGALAMPSPWREGMIAKVLPDLFGRPKVKAFLRVLIKGAPADVIKTVLPRYSKDIEPIDRFDLLSSRDKEIRLLAIAALKDVNDLLLLKLITQRYQEEDDPEVRAAYERSIVTIRDRFN